MRKLVVPALLLLALASAAAAQDPNTPPVIASSPEAVVAAGEDTSATIEWGNLVIYWIKGLQVVLVTFLTGVLVYATSWMPGMIGIGARFVLANYGERLIKNALDFAVNAVEGAVKGEKMDINVGSAVVATAVERIFDLGNQDRLIKWVIKALGGREGLSEKVFRKLDLKPEATVGTVLGPVSLPPVAMRKYQPLPKGK